MQTDNSKFLDFPKRIISAVILCIVALVAIKVGGMLCVAFLSVCFATLVWEVFYICESGRFGFSLRQVLVPLAAFLIPILQFYDFLPIVTLVAIAGVSLVQGNGGGIKFFCIIYIGSSIILLQSLLLSNLLPNGTNHVLLLIVIVAASDIGGYLVGKLLGGPKIFVTVSPKKTWSGSLGGLAFAIILAIVVNPLEGYSPIALVVIALVIGITAQFGDLFESALKRKFKVKDSGFFLPGHGGLFDRFDGLILAIPIYILIHYYYDFGGLS